MAREQFQTLTEPMYYILLALTEECCGVDIMEKVRQISGGRVRVGPGTLYAMLSKFEENNMIQKTAEEGDIVVALVENETTLKRYYKDHQRQCVRLHPENSRMKDIYVQECTIQGVAQHVIKAL